MRLCAAEVFPHIFTHRVHQVVFAYKEFFSQVFIRIPAPLILYHLSWIQFTSIWCPVIGLWSTCFAHHPWCVLFDCFSNPAFLPPPQILKLSYNKLREISSSLTFSGLTSLLRLYLDHNLLQHIHPRALLQLPSLRLLRLQGNRLHQLHPHALCTLSLLNTYYFSTLRWALTLKAHNYNHRWGKFWNILKV